MSKLSKFIKYTGLFLTTIGLAACASGSTDTEKTATSDSGELSGEIVMWHSFTQGPRLESIQKSADEFMEQNPKVK
ncbi:TPA: sugar ABC transporter substrate-binding protein, partial [Streptococcus suis]